jgi:hypothetical protein
MLPVATVEIWATVATHATVVALATSGDLANL